jgi:TolA-binding protein
MSDADHQLRELGKQLPYERPDAERREGLRSSLLVAATQDRERGRGGRRWVWIGGGFAAGALAAAAIALYVGAPATTTKPEPAAMQHARVQIDAPATAKVEHIVSGTDELVRVRDGVVRVGVSEGKPVRTKTSDAEVEGAGHYEVAVVGDKLERVTVADGTARVTVRVGEKQQQVFLAAGQSWRPDVDVEIVEDELAPIATAGETHFQQGWSLLRAGKAREAAAELAIAADAGGPLAGDARYFEGVARARAGDLAGAERALVQFLDGKAPSSRRGRATLMLGKLLHDRGELGGARARFEAAVGDADPAIAAAARAHLEALR